MNKQGTVVRWDDAKAFGFIRSPHTVSDIFFHIRDYRGDPSPQTGMVVEFEEIHVGGKGPRAMAVRRLGATPPQKAKATATRPNALRSHAHAKAGKQGTAGSRHPTTNRSRERSPSAAVWLLLAIWLCLLLWGTSNGQLTWTLLFGAVALNMITFVAYWQDKAAAQRGAWRTPESTLHMLSLAGGWPAARLAQQRLRHKSSKAPFLLVYAATAVLNTLALGAWVFNFLPPT